VSQSTASGTAVPAYKIIIMDEVLRPFLCHARPYLHALMRVQQRVG